MTGNWNLDFSPSYLFFDQLSRVASPYQLNPLNLNPLRDLVLRQVNFERLHRCDCIKMFISATSVRTGKVKVFKHAELSVDTLMASACLPYPCSSRLSRSTARPIAKKGTGRTPFLRMLHCLARGESQGWGLERA